MPPARDSGELGVKLQPSPTAREPGAPTFGDLRRRATGPSNERAGPPLLVLCSIQSHSVCEPPLPTHTHAGGTVYLPSTKANTQLFQERPHRHTQSNVSLRPVSHHTGERVLSLSSSGSRSRCPAGLLRGPHATENRASLHAKPMAASTPGAENRAHKGASVWV